MIFWHTPEGRGQGLMLGLLSTELVHQLFRQISVGLYQHLLGHVGVLI